MAKNINIVSIVNESGCFDLQFRQDIKKDRLNSPIYYRWKAQFIITGEMDMLEKIQNIFHSGKIHTIGTQNRYSVQNIDEIKNSILPYFTKHPLIGRKKKDFDLWAKAINIIAENKGKALTSWDKKDFQTLIDIQKSSQTHKDKPKILKWLSSAKNIVETLK